MEASKIQQMMVGQEDPGAAHETERLTESASPEDSLGRTALYDRVEFHLIRDLEVRSPEEMKPISRNSRTIERIGQLVTLRGFSRSADKRRAAQKSKRPLRITPDL